MPHHCDSRCQNRNLARDLVRDVRHSKHPTHIIVNEGELVVDQRTLRNSNAVIYNAPGSTLRLAPSKKSTPASSASKTVRFAPEAPWWAPAPEIHTCRGCFQRREMYYRGYCHDCAAMRLVSYPKQRHAYLRPAPERKLVGWR